MKLLMIFLMKLIFMKVSEFSNGNLRLSDTALNFPMKLSIFNEILLFCDKNDIHFSPYIFFNDNLNFREPPSDKTSYFAYYISRSKKVQVLNILITTPLLSSPLVIHLSNLFCYLFPTFL